MLVTRIFSSLHSVFHCIKERNHQFGDFNLSSANAFNLVQSKNLSIDKELIYCLWMLWILSGWNLLVHGKELTKVDSSCIIICRCFKGQTATFCLHWSWCKFVRGNSYTHTQPRTQASRDRQNHRQRHLHSDTQTDITVSLLICKC